MKSLKKTSTITAIIVIFTIISKFLGFFKQRLIASTFGISADLDTFWAAFTIPDLIFSLIILGSFNAAFIPMFIKARNKSKYSAVNLLNTILTYTVYLWIGLGGIIAISLKWFINFLSTSPKADIYLKILSIQRLSQSSTHLFYNLTIIMLLSSFILSISSVFTAFLLSNKRYFVASLPPIAYNVGIVSTLAILSKIAPDYGVYNLAIAIVVGSLFHLIIQIPTVIHLSWKPFISTKHKFLKEIVLLSLPRIFAVSAKKISSAIATIYNMSLGPGILSAYNYAYFLQSTPVHIFTFNIIKVIFPKLSEMAPQFKTQGETFKKLYRKTLFWLLISMGYVSVILLGLRYTIIEILFASRNFDLTAIYLTSLALTGFMPSIIFDALTTLNLRVFYSFEKAKGPLIAAIVGVISNVLFSKLLLNMFSNYSILQNLIKNWSFTDFIYILTHKGNNYHGILGIAIGISIGTFIEMSITFFMLNMYIKLKEDIIKPMTLDFIKFTILCIIWTLILNHLESLNFINSQSIFIKLIFVVLISLIVFISFVLFWPKRFRRLLPER